MTVYACGDIHQRTADPLGLEAVDEGFGHGVVERVADGADRAEHVAVVEGLGEVDRPVLRSGIRMVHELDVGAAATPGQRHPRRVEDQRRAHVGGELSADDPSAVDVDDEADVDHALPAADIGEVRDPEPIRPLGAEIAADEIRRPRGGGGLSRCAGSRRRSSSRCGRARFARSATRPGSPAATAARWRAGSRRTPTRPRSCRSARRRSGRGARR